MKKSKRVTKMAIAPIIAVLSIIAFAVGASVAVYYWAASTTEVGSPINVVTVGFRRAPQGEDACVTCHSHSYVAQVISVGASSGGFPGGSCSASGGSCHRGTVTHGAVPGAADFTVANCSSSHLAGYGGLGASGCHVVSSGVETYIPTYEPYGWVDYSGFRGWGYGWEPTHNYTSNCLTCHEGHEGWECFPCHNYTYASSRAVTVDQCETCHGDHDWDGPITSACHSAPDRISGSCDGGSQHGTPPSDHLDCTNCHYGDNSQPHKHTGIFGIHAPQEELNCSECHVGGHGGRVKELVVYVRNAGNTETNISRVYVDGKPYAFLVVSGDLSDRFQPDELVGLKLIDLEWSSGTEYHVVVQTETGYRAEGWYKPPYG